MRPKRLVGRGQPTLGSACGMLWRREQPPERQLASASGEPVGRSPCHLVIDVGGVRRAASPKPYLSPSPSPAVCGVQLHPHPHPRPRPHPHPNQAVGGVQLPGLTSQTLATPSAFHELLRKGRTRLAQQHKPPAPSSVTNPSPSPTNPRPNPYPGPNPNPNPYPYPNPSPSPNPNPCPNPNPNSCHRRRRASSSSSCSKRCAPMADVRRLRRS